MTAKKLAQLYERFTEEQKQLLTTKKISGQHTADEWLALFKDVSVYDRHQDLRWASRSWMASTILAIFLGIFSIIALVVSKFHPIAIIVFIAVIGLVVLGQVWKHKYVANDLNNHLRMFIVPSLVMLKEEVKRNQLIHLELSLDKTEQEKFRKEEIGHSTYYEQFWLKARTKLADGTRLEWNGRDLYRVKKYWKRSASGKSKQKIKRKTKYYLEVKVAIPKSKYVYQDKGGLSLKEDPDFYVFKGRGKNIALDPSNKSMEVNLFLSLIAGAYKQVKQAA